MHCLNWLDKMLGRLLGNTKSKEIAARLYDLGDNWILMQSTYYGRKVVSFDPKFILCQSHDATDAIY